MTLPRIDTIVTYPLGALRPLTAAREAGGAAPLDLAARPAGAGIDPMRRPETLTPEEFVHLADTLIPLSVL